MEKEFPKLIFVQGKFTDPSTKWEGDGKHKIPLDLSCLQRFKILKEFSRGLNPNAHEIMKQCNLGKF